MWYTNIAHSKLYYKKRFQEILNISSIKTQLPKVSKKLKCFIIYFVL